MNIEEVHDRGILEESRSIFALAEVAELDCARIMRNAAILVAQSKEPITLHVMSTGGNTDAALACYDCLRSIQCPVTIVGFGSVYSAAALVFQAADKRVIMPNSELMIHYGRTETPEDMTPRESKSYATSYDRLIGRTIEIYAKRLKRGPKYKKLSMAKIRAIIHGKLKADSDWYITAEEALELGFADEIA